MWEKGPGLSRLLVPWTAVSHLPKARDQTLCLMAELRYLAGFLDKSMCHLIPPKHLHDLWTDVLMEVPTHMYNLTVKQQPRGLWYMWPLSFQIY